MNVKYDLNVQRICDHFAKHRLRSIAHRLFKPINRNLLLEIYRSGPARRRRFDLRRGSSQILGTSSLRD